MRSPPMPRPPRWPNRSSRAHPPTFSSQPTSTGWTISPGRISSRQTRARTLLGNELVLIAAQGSGVKVDLKMGADLAGALKGGKLAVGDVKAVPAGKYAKAALEKLGLWKPRSRRASRRPRMCAPPSPSWRAAKRQWALSIGRTPRPSRRLKSPVYFPRTHILPSSILWRSSQPPRTRMPQPCSRFLRPPKRATSSGTRASRFCPKPWR